MAYFCKITNLLFGCKCHSSYLKTRPHLCFTVYIIFPGDVCGLNALKEVEKGVCLLFIIVIPLYCFRYWIWILSNICFLVSYIQQLGFLSKQFGSSGWHMAGIREGNALRCRERGSTRRQERIWSSDLSSLERENALLSEHTEKPPHLQSFMTAYCKMRRKTREARTAGFLWSTACHQRNANLFCIAAVLICWAESDTR